MKGVIEQLGGVKMFAAIAATFPTGATCTCTNGTKTLRAKNTGGKWVFAIPKPEVLPETWTVTATANDGSNMGKTETVEITAEGQLEAVNLTFALILFDGVNKINNTAATGTWRKSGVDTFTVTEDKIYFALSDSGESNEKEICYARTGNKINLTDYDSLSVNISSIEKDSTDLYLAISADGKTRAASISLAKGNRTLTISEYSGEYYVAFFCEYNLYGVYEPNFTATYLGLT